MLTSSALKKIDGAGSRCEASRRPGLERQGLTIWVSRLLLEVFGVQPETTVLHSQSITLALHDFVEPGPVVLVSGSSLAGILRHIHDFGNLGRDPFCNGPYCHLACLLAP